MKDYYYADGVGAVVFSEGMVRMDLFHYGEKISTEPGTELSFSRELTGQLILPPMGFLLAFEAMGQLIGQMEKAGLLVKKKAEGVASASVNFTQAGSVQANSVSEVSERGDSPQEPLLHGSPNFTL